MGYHSRSATSESGGHQQRVDGGSFLIHSLSFPILGSLERSAAGTAQLA
jgi:hypothetical protein